MVTINKYDVEFSLTSSGRYDYSANSEWNHLQIEVKNIEEKMKLAYKGQEVDEETGEILIKPIFLPFKIGLKITKIKK